MQFDNISFNRLSNCKNRFQGEFKKVLCVCSAGLLRSPTAAVVLSQEPYNYNTRAVGLDESHALIAADAVHLEWADEIVVMEPLQARIVTEALKQMQLDKPVVTLNVPDKYRYRDPMLMKLIKENYDAAQ